VVRSSRYIPAEVKRAVWARDRGRCAFVSQAGHRCSETGELEFHHVNPHGDGGLPTTKNIELRCRGHNQYEADQYYGPWSATVIEDASVLYFDSEIDDDRTRPGPNSAVA
jgi:5-methylcytosine-specific restriction endonuclease McrA